MRLFWELVKLSFRRQLTYRAATLAGLATNFFFGLLRASVLIALYGQRHEAAGISLLEAITFTALSQAVIALLSMFSWHKVMDSVYSGDVASDLLKPMNYFVFWLAQDLGQAIANLLTRGLPIMVSYALFLELVSPPSAAHWAVLTAALTLSWLISFSWRFLVNLASFWIPNAFGIVRFAFILSWFFSGFLMPLRFFPDWFVRLAYLTPFPHTVNAIVEIYLGVVTGPALLQTLLGQLLWVALLVSAGQVVLRAGVRRLVIQGG